MVFPKEVSVLCLTVVFLSVLVGQGQGGVADGVDYYLADNCDKVIEIPENKDLVLYSQSGLQYNANQDCSVVIQARPSQQCLVTFSIFDVAKNDDGSCEDSVYLYNGNDNSAVVLHGNGGLCGLLSGLEDSYETDQENLTVNFQTDIDGFGGGFAMTITSFYNGTCTNTEFKCTNGNCIDAVLEDNFRDNCGDTSDENIATTTVLGWWEKLMDFGLAAAIGILVAGVVVIIILIVCCVCCCVKKASPV